MTAGRPKKYGKKDEWMRVRLVMFLVAFERARNDGKKYADAINLSVEAVKGLGFKMSEREAKRIFKEAGWTKENTVETLRCKIETVQERSSTEFGLEVLTLGVGEVPKFEKLKHKPLRQKFSKKFNEKT